MGTLKAIIKGLLAFFAISCITGAMFERTAVSIAENKTYGYYVVAFVSVVVLHWLIWQYIVVDSPFVGSNPKAFIVLPLRLTWISGITLFGYTVIARHCERGSRYDTPNVSTVVTIQEEMIYGYSFGFILIVLGIASRLRLLNRNLQPTSLENPEDDIA
jgi:hypothetical protein